MRKTSEQGMEQGPMEKPGHKRKSYAFSKNSRRAAYVAIGAAPIVWAYGMLWFFQSQYPWMQDLRLSIEFTAGFCCVLAPALWALILFMKPVEKAAGKVKKAAAGMYSLYTGCMRQNRMEARYSLRPSVIASVKTTPHTRTRARSHRSHARPSFANAGGNSSDDGSGSGDEPPRHEHSVTQPNPSEKPKNPDKKTHPWRRLGSCRVPRAFHREGGQTA